MSAPMIDPNVSRVLERTLRQRPWMDPRWDDAARRFAGAMSDALRTTGPDHSVAAWIAAASAAARAELPSAQAAYAETWTRVVLALVAREVVREAARDEGQSGALAPGLFALGDAIAEASPTSVGARDGAGAWKLHAIDRVVTLARKALVETRNRTLTGAASWGFVVACFDQLSHALTLFMARENAGLAQVRDAVLRADQLARRNRVPGWVDASAATRRSIARQCLAEVAATIALVAPGAATSTPESRDASLWLARTASAVSAAAAHVDEWFPLSGSEAAASPPHPAPAIAAADAPPADASRAALSQTELTLSPRTGGMETAMKDTSQSIVKTLQTDATEAAWRTAGSQFVKLAREPLVGLLSRHLGPDDDSMRARVASFLETELGTAMLAALLSAGLSAVPAVGGDVPQRLSRELRVRAMADAGDVLADVLMGPLRQVMALYLQDVGPAVSVAPAALSESNRAPANVVAMPEREASRT